MYSPQLPGPSSWREQPTRVTTMESKISLPLRELEALTRAFLSILLPLFDAWITRNQACLLQSWTKVRVEFDQSASNAVTNRARLARGTAPFNINQKVKLIRRLSQLQRLPDDHPQGLVGKILIEGFLVDADISSAGPQIDSCRGSLSSPCPVILNFSHSYVVLYSLCVLTVKFDR